MEEVSWYQARPEVSLKLFQKYKVPYEAKILDVGGGDSFLVDYLLELGYKNLTVVDISEKAIERAKNRLGSRAEDIEWVVSDIVDFTTENSYDVWHDRAAFHFLTTTEEVDRYKGLVEKHVREQGYFFIGTFSEQGPTKCSGIEIQQYSQSQLTALFMDKFDKMECFAQRHQTPFDTIQEFLFCVLQKRN